jgi:hypothetical protein
MMQKSGIMNTLKITGQTFRPAQAQEVGKDEANDFIQSDS